MGADQQELIGRIIDDRYRLERFLGLGSIGYVYAAQEVAVGRNTLGSGPFGGGSDATTYAVEVIPVGASERQRAIEEHLVRVRELHHQHLLQIFPGGGGTADRSAANLRYLVTEPRNDSLFKHLESHRLMDHELLEMLSGLMKALAYLHARGMVHGAIALQNIVHVGGDWKLAAPAHFPKTGESSPRYCDDLKAMRDVAVACLSRKGSDLTEIAEMPEQLRPLIQMCKDSTHYGAGSSTGATELCLHLMKESDAVTELRRIQSTLKLAHFRRSGALHLEWPRIDCEMRFYALDLAQMEAPSRAGLLLLAQDLDTVGRPLVCNPVERPEGMRAEFPLIDDGVRIMPVLVRGSAAILMGPLSYSALDDVKDLSCSWEAGVVRVRWRWPEGVRAAMVVARTDRSPSGPQDLPGRRETRTALDVHGGVDLKAPEGVTQQEPWRLFVTVYSAVNSGRGWSYSAPGVSKELTVVPDRPPTVKKRRWWNPASGGYRIVGKRPHVP